MEGNPHSLRLYLNYAFYDLFFLFLICLFWAWGWGIGRQYHSVTLARLILTMYAHQAGLKLVAIHLSLPLPAQSSF